MKKINLPDVKQALLDERFRKTLPPEFEADIKKFLHNPGCSCNHQFYKKVISKAAEQLSQYYPEREKVESDQLQKEVEKIAQNEWTVINCHIDELAAKLRKLPVGRMQIDVARYQDQVTVIVNQLDAIF